MSCHRSMACLQPNRSSCVDSLRHPFFSLRRNQPVVSRDLIPTRPHFPSWSSRLLFEATCSCWLLRESPYQRFCLVEIVAEGLAKLFRSDPQKPILVLTDVSRALRRRSPRPKTFQALPFIEGGSRQIDKAHDVWRVPSPRDDGATIGMSDQ